MFTNRNRLYFDNPIFDRYKYPDRTHYRTRNGFTRIKFIEKLEDSFCINTWKFYADKASHKVHYMDGGWAYIMPDGRRLDGNHELDVVHRLDTTVLLDDDIELKITLEEIDHDIMVLQTARERLAKNPIVFDISLENPLELGDIVRRMPEGDFAILDEYNSESGCIKSKRWKKAYSTSRGRLYDDEAYPCVKRIAHAEEFSQ